MISIVLGSSAHVRQSGLDSGTDESGWIDELLLGLVLAGDDEEPKDAYEQVFDPGVIVHDDGHHPHVR